jgi:2-(1,2-epoxy-1,2-dihydrophenyl)acetyl-CoA isomerase
MATNDLLAERRDGILYLTMNRPDKLNAMSDAMLGALVEELSQAGRDNEIGCVVLTGAGRGFCSGGDIGGMSQRNQAAAQAGAAPMPVEYAVGRLRHSMEASRLLHEIPKPTIAAVNGAAAGAGLSLAMACDLRLAADNARFTTAFGNVGFSGDFGGTWTLTQLVGPAKARELYFMPDVIGADDALRIGLVNRVYPAASFRDEVDKVAHRIASGPRIAYAYMKANLNEAINCEFKVNLDREAFGQTLTGRTQDHREAVKAFLEKRPPKFQGH